eukprot:TRINITY_DN9737_c0_g1_i3.p1 TRINITY_DN9737_c0_g1~~TRINITY_DN9737_c0_g1_i3.p1  ORF type:complete len:212 (-),score=29.14 TRINITY_DN9737_c0_g1_i3:36-671(-)
MGRIKQTPVIMQAAKTSSVLKRVDNYIVDTEQKLGQGTFGIVCTAYKNEENSELLAVKLIPKTMIKTEYNQRMLTNEIKKQFEMSQNENVVKLYDVLVSANYIYLFMEYCEGGDLATYLEKAPGGKLPESEVRLILRDLMNAFRGLIERGLIHRDVKAQNILRRRGRWKLADFGFSRELDEGQKTQTLVGSPQYMAPVSYTHLTLPTIYSV